MKLEGIRNKPQNGDYLCATTAVSSRPVSIYKEVLTNPVKLGGMNSVAPSINGDISGKVSSAGGSEVLVISNVQPSLVVNFIIAVSGLYPLRND